MWVKRGGLGATNYNLFGATGYDIVRFSSTYPDAIEWEPANLSGYAYTPAVFRDPSAWYHIVFAWDSSNATAANRMKIYVNNVQQTITYTIGAPAQNTQSFWNSNVASTIGAAFNITQFFDGYLADVNFIDGQALTPSSFGESNATTGVWQPKAYSGTGYGNNGFYLKFTDVGATSGSNTGYGKDFAGTNYWTTNNFNSTSTSTSYDSMIDTPTPYDNGGNGVGNYAVLNPLAFNSSTISAGNLEFAGVNLTSVRGSIQIPSSGMWYWELTPTTTMPNYVSLGLAEKSANGSAAVGTANTWGLYPAATIYTWSGTSSTNTGVSTPALGCTFALAYDASTGKLWLGYAASGAGSITWVGGGSPASGTSPTYTLSTSLELFPFVCSNNTASDKSAINFGQRPFTYTPPSGFKALNTQNLPTPTIAAGNKHFDISTYTGNGSSISVTNSGSFQPDFVWIKKRSAAANNILFDGLRGVTKYLLSDSTLAEGTDVQTLTAFNSSGFSYGNETSGNANGATFVGWQWNAGGNTIAGTGTGGITNVSYRANQTAGFSVVTYTGSGANGTVTHGLGVAPSMLIGFKRSGTANHPCWHSSFAGTEFILLNSTAAKYTTPTTVFNGAPDSTVFKLGTDTDLNANGATAVMYCFAAVAGYSAFGSYTGNGSADGPFVFTGMRSRYIIIKSSSTAGTGWYIYDTARNTYNVHDLYLRPEVSDAEGTLATLDVVSNGFKLRSSNSQFNGSGNTYIYAAFAENPFSKALAR